MLRTCCCLLLAFEFANLAMADDPKPAADQKEIKLESTIGKDAKPCACRACTINFCKELGVPLEYLSDLGHRIHQARMSPDPVELALSAQSLAVAEKVSGKKASLTAEEVLKEALTLGKQRGVSVELAALASIVPDAATQKELAKELTGAKKREEEEKSALKSGERSRELFGTLVVINHSDECLRIFVSGRYRGTVHSGQTIGFHVHDHNYHTELQAICEEDNDVVSTACVEGHQHRYTWHIH